MKRQLLTLAKLPGCFLFFWFVSSCTQTKLLYKPIIINRDKLNSAFSDTGVNVLVFQTLLDEARHKKEKFGLVAFAPNTGDKVKVFSEKTLFEKRPTEYFQEFKRFKKNVNNAYGNYYLRKGVIADSLPEYPFILLYPALLEDNSRYIKYDLYFSMNVSNLPGDTAAISTGRNYAPPRPIVPINAALNPSPPR